MDSMNIKSNYSYNYWCWTKPSIINKYSGKATHDLINHLKAKNIRVKKMVCWSDITLNLNKQNYWSKHKQASSFQMSFTQSLLYSVYNTDYFFTEKKDTVGLAI